MNTKIDEISKTFESIRLNQFKSIMGCVISYKDNYEFCDKMANVAIYYNSNDFNKIDTTLLLYNIMKQNDKLISQNDEMISVLKQIKDNTTKYYTLEEF